MCTAAVTVERLTPAKEVARLMHEHRVSAVPVLTSKDQVASVVSEADLLRTREGRPATPRRRRLRSRGRGARTAGQLMTSPTIAIHPDAPIGAAARRMNSHRVRLLPVVDADGVMIGVVSRRNLLSIFLRTDEAITEEVLGVLTDVLLLDPGQLTVSTHNAVVTLAGQVTEEDSRRAAVRLAGDVDGVLTVLDKLSAAPLAQRQADHP